MAGVDLSNKERTKKVTLKQLNFLEYELKEENLGRRMQRFFPEGYVFIHALYGLTWCELALNYEIDSVQHERAYSEAKYAYDKINSHEGKRVFTKNLNPEYGAFYTGWKNYLLGKILSFHSISSNDSTEFKYSCNQIAASLSATKSPYLKTYPYGCWPADGFFCVASLKLFDQVIEPKYEKQISDWVAKVKLNLDPFTGLVPHSVYPIEGGTIEGARGCSISLILRILAEIDTDFAQEQYEVYKHYFKIRRLWVPAIREYPIGKNGRGDIDSGPVIWKVGFAGTIVSIGVYKTFGDYKTANKVSNAMESFGFSYSIRKRKRYVFGLMPMADAFIAWSRVSPARVNLE